MPGARSGGQRPEGRQAGGELAWWLPRSHTLCDSKERESAAGSLPLTAMGHARMISTRRKGMNVTAEREGNFFASLFFRRRAARATTAEGEPAHQGRSGIRWRRMEPPDWDGWWVGEQGPGRTAGGRSPGPCGG